MKPLVVTPAPYPSESLLSYALRLSEANGYDTPGYMLTYANFDERGIQTAGFPITKLAGLVAKDPSVFESVAYSGTAKDGAWEFRILGHSLGKTTKYRPLRLKKPTFCPHCVEQEGYIDAFWDLSLAVVCPRHHCKPIDRCQQCDNPIRLLRKGLTTCNCGAILSGSVPAEIQPAVIELMELIWAKLHREPLSTIKNSSGLPLVELYGMSLRSLLTFLPTLAKLTKSKDNSDEIPDPYDVISKAADILKLWPHNFYQFLRDYGSRASNQTVNTIGFRKRFQLLYQNLFRHSSFSREGHFLRNEFLRFGLQEWGESIVDNKMLRNEPIEQRYMSISKLAKIIGVRDVTLKNWADKGYISLKSVKLNNRTQYVADLHSLPIPKTAKSPIMQERPAASYLGIPFSVLSALKRLGTYSVQHMPIYKLGYCKQDLDVFLKRVLSASPPLADGLPNNLRVISLAHIMNRLVFRSKNGKANFLANYLDGKLSSVGKTADKMENIYFEKSVVKSFIANSENEHLAKKGAITIQGAARLLEVNQGTIYFLVDGGYIKTSSGTKHVSLNKTSVLAFSNKYILLSKIASSQNTSSKKLFSLCERNNIQVKYTTRSGIRCYPFISRKDSERLIKELLANSKSDIRKQLRVKSSSNTEAKVNKYLEQLALSNELLPRKGHALNILRIAEDCEIDRETLYRNKIARTILENYDAKERGLHDIPEQPQQSLRNYINRLVQNQSKPPRKKDGALNRSAIASICKFGRHRLYSDKEVIELLEKLEAET